MMTDEQANRIYAGVRAMIEATGENPNAEGLQKTPYRVLCAFQELTSGYSIEPAKLLRVTFAGDSDEMVVLSGIRFTSLCEHHLLPFTGVAAVAYLPQGGRVVGISKLARLVDAFARRLQIQERLTRQIADTIQTVLQPLGVGVVMRATHGCIACRGAMQPDARMVTSALLGEFRNESVRHEFLSLSGIAG